MKHVPLILLLVMAGALACSKKPAVQGPDSYEAALRQAKDRGTIVMLDFWAVW